MGVMPNANTYDDKGGEVGKPSKHDYVIRGCSPSRNTVSKRLCKKFVTILKKCSRSMNWKNKQQILHRGIVHLSAVIEFHGNKARQIDMNTSSILTMLDF